MIKIVDCGSQLTQNIARRIRELGVFTEIVPFDRPVNSILTNDVDGIIISGSQFSVYDTNSPLPPKELFKTNIPILGICFGQQLIASLFGGKVKPTDNREYGETTVILEKSNQLFTNIKKKFKVWMSHSDIVQEVPKGFKIIAKSKSGHIASINKNNVYAVQFHPEVDHTEYGREILNNFIKICNAQRTWDAEKHFDNLVEKMTDKIKGKIGVGGISGGVDSTTASVLMSQIADKDYHPIFVDNGLLRLNELMQVKTILEPFNLNVKYIDAKTRFLNKLKGVRDPDLKRKFIGYEFVAVFEEEAKKIKNTSYLVQGTLYPDIIESVPVYGSSSKIKRHHNVGGLPEKLELEVVEPFKELFKDEVRQIALQKLGISKEVVWRHPFPGPGLAVRIIDEVTYDKLELLRKADDIFISEIKERGLYYDISQAFAVLTNTNAIGVMGDEGTYQATVALRAVTTNDFMTSDWFDFSKNDLVAISNRIINEVEGVNRVLYDISQKPPSTIEFE